jgi:hypothetical protein
LVGASIWKPGTGAGVARKRRLSWATAPRGFGTWPTPTFLARCRSSICITLASTSGTWPEDCIPNDSAGQQAWIKIHQKQLLDKGKIEKLVLSLRSTRSTNTEVLDKIRTEADYFERNAERMRYPKFRRQHLFIGSGVIEAGCKTAIGGRLKQSGMFWTVRRANVIIALRCCYLNGRFETYWEERREQLSYDPLRRGVCFGGCNRPKAIFRR